MKQTKALPSLWSGMDRKALAVAEFTLRQQRKRLSTWVVLLVGIAAMGVLTMFYIDAMTWEYEAIDNDGDSYDWDLDGYPNGQEAYYGTDIFNADSHPGLLDSTILPDDPSVWVNEDDFDWDALEEGSVGNDDNGDCDVEGRTASQKTETETVFHATLSWCKAGGQKNTISSAMGTSTKTPTRKHTPSKPSIGVSCWRLANLAWSF